MRIGVTIDAWINKNVPGACAIINGNSFPLSVAKDIFGDITPETEYDMELPPAPGEKFVRCYLVFHIDENEFQRATNKMRRY